MTFDYPKTAATATRLLNRFGAAATIKRQSGTAYNPATGTSVPTYTDVPTTAAVFDYAQKYIDGTMIKQGDKQAFCASAARPENGDKFAWQGADYTIISVKPVSPAGVDVLFEVQIRG